MAKSKKELELRQVIRQAVRLLEGRIQVDLVILYGSHAAGRADAWSDVDLAVVSPDFSGMGQRKIEDLLVEVALNVDPVVEIRPYTREDLREARPTNFLGWILSQGRVVYENGALLDRWGRTKLSPCVD